MGLFAMQAVQGVPLFVHLVNSLAFRLEVLLEISQIAERSILDIELSPRSDMPKSGLKRSVHTHRIVYIAVRNDRFDAFTTDQRMVEHVSSEFLSQSLSASFKWKAMLYKLISSPASSR